MGDPIGPPNKRRRGEESKRYRFSRRQGPKEYKSRVRKGGTKQRHNESEEIPGIGV